MQGVTATLGATHAPVAAQIPYSRSARQVTRPNRLPPRSSFLCGLEGQVHDLFAPANNWSTTVRTGSTPLIQATTSWINPFKTAPVSDEQAVLYKGIATIAKKRVGLGNLLIGDLVDVQADLEDKNADLLGKKVEIQLVGVDLQPGKETPKVSAVSTVQEWVKELDPVADIHSYPINFKVPKDFGEVGAIIVTNNHPNEFFMQALTLELQDKSTLEFTTKAWVYPGETGATKSRVFFSNKVYLPSDTPPGLKALREQELKQLRGDGTGERKQSDRIYDYDFYNDLGTPGGDLARPVLGGSKDLPYPRRVRTGRPKTKQDPETETRLPETVAEIPYIPSDEYFNRTKNSTFLAASFKGVTQSIAPAIDSKLTHNADFGSFKDIWDLYDKGLAVDMHSPTWFKFAPEGSLVILDVLFREKGDKNSVLKYAVPQVVRADQNAWKEDEEFGRQFLAGTNPGVIALLTEFPPKSSLDPAEYGQATALTDEHILPYLEEKSVAQAIQEKKLFIVDYHDAFLPFINAMNADEEKGYKSYATRTIFYRTSKGQLKPIAIELSLPPAQSGEAASNRVFTPADAADHLWDLAKIHATAIDANYHEVVVHFTFTHGTMEPFVIAANRQLSELHPIKILLKPYFKDTLNINSGARGLLINANGIVEGNFSAGQYAMQLGSKAYGAFWGFDRQAFPQDLIARGMAEPADASYPGSVKLVLEDYPYAEDGLEVWDAIKSWVADYVDLTYKGSDEAVKADKELQAFWTELVNVGHGDLKDAPWWPKLDSTESLVQIITTIAWIAGPLHAAVNFGQYAYYGFPPNKPSATRTFVPEKGSPEYEELQNNPEKFFLSTITSSAQATKVMSILELLATHSEDEVYIGTRLSHDWSWDPAVLKAFQKFSDKVAAIKDNITKRNEDPRLINRRGPAKVPYTLLFPTSGSGLTGQGVPNSISI